MVVETKLVTPNGFAIPLFTEFVENTGNDPKQDCELKAFYRMADKIKAHFPRLPILLTIDGLFACGPVFEVCKEHGWKFMVVLKDGSLPTVNQEFRSLLPLQPENRLTFRFSDGKPVWNNVSVGSTALTTLIRSARSSRGALAPLTLHRCKPNYTLSNRRSQC